MSSIRHITVEPNRASALAGDLPSVIKLPGYELWFTFIKNVHTVPISLDVDSFVEALAVTLNEYPHVAGRLQRIGDSWNILLTNSGVSLAIESFSTRYVGIQDAWVIQDDLNPFLNLPYAGGNPIHGDAPLLRLKLSIAMHETAIGVCWHHTLGDATVMLRFMRSLSQSYQGVQNSYTPTFIKHEFPTPSRETVEHHLPLMPHLARTYPVCMLSALYGEMNKNVVPIRCRVADEKLQQLREMVMLDVQETNITLSIQDCLTAYVVTVLHRCAGTPIRVVTNAASYRHVTAPFIDSNVAGNAIYIVPTFLDDQDQDQTLASIAVAIRRSIQRCREPNFIEGWMAVASHQMLRAANAGESLFFAGASDCVSVNSNLSLDWRSAHFGSPEGTRFFTSGVNNQYLRVFRSNPTGHDVGASIASAKAVDICFGVPDALKSRVMNLLDTELGSPDFPRNLNAT